MIKMFVTDIDGTLLPTGGTVSAANVEAIQAMANAGVKVVLATGRMYRAALNVAAQLKVPVPIICYNGALIKSSAGEVLYTHYMDTAIVLKLIKFFEERGRHIQTYSDDVLYVPARNAYVEYYETTQKVSAVEVGWEGLRAHVNNVTKLLSISDDVDELVDSMNAIRKIFGSEVEVTRSTVKFAEFMASGVTKAGAIKIFADKLGIDNAEILAIGDSENDLNMLTSVGLGVAMGNAVDAVKAACTHITDTCEHDGFAKAVYDYVL